MVQFPQLKVIVNQVGDALNGYFANNLQQRKPNGFTIVELLIVIVVIGILAAIVIVAYQGVTNRANDTTIQSDLRNISKQLEHHKLMGTSDVYPSNTDSSLAAVGIKATKEAYSTSSGNLLYCGTADNSAYALASQSKSGNIYTITSSGGIAPYTDHTSMGSYIAICTNLLGVNYPRFGFTTGAWRSWVQ
ncbi:hypothetical protein A2707_00720 [Candidatus Saccharibacteria bacterium RIFCSPHIGHO2_01_FULL_45_15]|nr:MAG: hypothetical protein A2707_00720 [Candidatus Saccharibacteria bacterium RIFCSPHIGHO2_01_FULL_45_15]OGL26897.1 MAG: hypothetical protein A3C39_01835 [Candidatus Saccharibacteria bacterium RIFCSPHIGHO2_02_FULL_46_12]OGL32207.1 MAG: hypothetical protein A3E76_04380 [Candidatus Saccharibacteria bacterium RIFCSPHIGHO2_12_FULL_44_22]